MPAYIYLLLGQRLSVVICYMTRVQCFRHFPALFDFISRRFFFSCACELRKKLSCRGDREGSSGLSAEAREGVFSWSGVSGAQYHLPLTGALPRLLFERTRVLPSRLILRGYTFEGKNRLWSWLKTSRCLAPTRFTA